MRLQKYMMLFLMVTICNLSFAQGWVLEFGAYAGQINGPCKFETYEFRIGNNTSGSMYLRGDNGKLGERYYLRGTDWDNLTNKTININIVSSPSCSGSTVPLAGSDNASNVNSSSNTCYRLSISGAGTGTIAMKYSSAGSSIFDFDMGYIFWQRLIIDTVRSCNAITLSTPRCLKGSATWEVTNTPNVESSWKEVSKTSKQITLTASELSALGLSSVYGVLYARVSDASLAGRTSEPQAFNVYAPPPTVLFNSSSDVICKGESNGTVTLQVSNTASQVNQFYINCTNITNGYSKIEPVVGTDPYPITDLNAGDWQFQVVNNYDKNYYGVCSTTIPYTMNEPTQVTIGFDTPLNNGYAIKCNGGSTGETTAIGSGGKGGYKDFSWSNGDTRDKITGLTAGTYTVTLKDANNCSATNQVTLEQPTALQVSLTDKKYNNGYSMSCWDKSDGSISSSVSGGITTQSYTYLWSTGATTDVISGLNENTYSLTVTDANSCTASSSVALTPPAKIDFAIDQLATLTCPGDNTAILEAKPVTATIIGAAHYNWSSGETTATITDKGAGTYSLTVSDDNTCSATKSIILADPAANTVSIVPQSNFNGSLIKCNGDSNGSLAAIVKDENNNTITAQNYLWTENGTTIGESATLTSISNLNEGLYKVAITYRTQCKAEVTYFLSDPDPVTASVSATTNYNGQAISCYNQTDATLRAVATGGTGTLNYTWDTGATGSLLTSIGAGFYTVTVKDVNGCTGTGSATLLNPEPVQALITDVSDYSGYGVSCYGVSDGTITSEGSGGTGVYTYAWSNGKTTAAITGLAAGDYTLTVSDNNNCKQSVGQTIITPAALSLAIADQKNISCFNGNDGTIELQSSGGTGTYTYSKDNAATWQTENIFSALKQGSYTILLRDGNSCTKNISSTLTQPTKINISFTNIEPAFCGNPAGTATAVVTGGVSGYTYSWQDSKANVVDTDATLSNAKGGIYTVNVTDNNACPMSNSVGITSTDGAKSTYTATAAKCFDSSDGSAAITITEGDGPFVIEWPDGQNTLQGVNLKKNQYDVLITDGHNCTVVQTVEVSAPDALQLSVKNKTVPTCNGSCDGQLTLEATGGVANYSYEWNGKTGATQTQLCTGTYPVIVKDANACILNMDVELEQPDPIEIKVANSTLATCKDGCDGSLEIAATGGNGGYSYTWAAGGDTNIKTNICPGTYSVTVTDVKNCKGTSVATLENTPALPLDLGGSVTLCVGQTYSLDAGPGWVSTKWGSNTGFASTDQKITLKEAGNYWVEVLSDKGCVAQDTFLLETSYDLLKAALLMQSEAAVGDTVVMIDISWPLPEKVEWSYPTEMKEVLNLGDAVFGQFATEGTYEVSLTAHLGECVDEVSKYITIRKDDAASAGGRLGYEEFVKEFSLYSNPNNGSFNVSVELIEEMPITVSVWHSPTGLLIKQVQKHYNKLYQLYFDLRPLSSGAYVLRLDYGKGKKYIRFVVD